MIDEYGESTLRNVRWHLAYYWDIRHAVAERRLEMKCRSGTPELTRNGHYSDPTQKEAMVNMEPIKSVRVSSYTVKDPEPWLAAIDKVFNNLEPESRKLIMMGFWKSKNWRAVVDELHMDKATYYRRRDRVVTLLAIEAAARGLIGLPDWAGRQV